MAKTMEKECPKCMQYAYGIREVREIFGLRTIRGMKRPQSYCKECASENKKRNRQPKPTKKQIAKKKVVKKTTIKKEEVFFKPINEKTNIQCVFTKTQLSEMLLRMDQNGIVKIGVCLKETTKPTQQRRWRK